MSRIPVVPLVVLLLSGCAGLATPEPEPGDEPMTAGYRGALGITPDPVGLPETPVGCVHSTVLELRNERDDLALTIERIETSDPTLRIGGPLPLSVPSSSSRFLDLHFVPETPGAVSATLEVWTNDAAGGPFELAVAAAAVAPSPPPVPATPLDVVLVVDVSTTMGATAALRAALPAFFETAESAGVDLRVGLVTFVNDVVVHGGGGFLDRAAIVGELDSQLDPETGGPDLTLPRHQLNFDFAENSLGALLRAARDFAFRPDARRTLLLVTDDTFLEPPATFSDGTPATASYDDVQRALDERGLTLHAVHASAAGRGLSSNFDGEPPLVRATGGNWLELADAIERDDALPRFLDDLAVGRICD